MRDKALDSANQAVRKGKGWAQGLVSALGAKMCSSQAVDLFKEAGDTKMSAHAAEHCRAEKMRDVVQPLIQLCPAEGLMGTLQELHS